MVEVDSRFDFINFSEIAYVQYDGEGSSRSWVSYILRSNSVFRRKLNSVDHTQEK
jgi:hypothetical protein